MGKIITMGEIMLRLSPLGKKRFVQAQQFDVVYGGGEANVAVSLANYGHHACFVTKVPTHEIGQAAVNILRTFGVDTSYIARGGERLGIYFLEVGASMRPSKVIYDRAHSAISEASVTDFDFDSIFEGASWFHWSGITPAISDQSAIVLEEALKVAKKHGVTVSVDLNYRKKLWSKQKAQKTMRHLMQYVDVCIGNEEDAQDCLGFVPENTNVESGKLNIAGYQDMMKKIMKEFKFKYIASSLRESISADDNGWSAMIYDGKEFHQSKRYDIRIVDRVGGGDSFAAGLIHGLLTKKCFKEALEFGVAASALKHTIFGDFNMVSVDEVENLIKGNTSGRVQR